MFIRGDLHIHSTASDGSLDPQGIIKLAKMRGIDIVAITDHNSVKGLSQAFEAGKKWGVAVIPGVELSTVFKGESIHILGYFRNKNFSSPDFQEILKQVRRHKVKNLRKKLGDYYKHSSSKKYLSTWEGIYILRSFDASVVLAHPVRISKKNLFPLLDLPFDGIEAKYCKSSHCDTEYFISTALKRFPFYTGGSDFHSHKKKDRKHCLIGEPYLNAYEIKRFLKYSKALVISG